MINLKLFCTLIDPVVTHDGDFIPAGTPVELVNGTKNYEQVVVITNVFMTGEAEEAMISCVTAGPLEFRTDKNNLQYLRCERSS